MDNHLLVSEDCTIIISVGQFTFNAFKLSCVLVDVYIPDFRYITVIVPLGAHNDIVCGGVEHVDCAGISELDCLNQILKCRQVHTRSYHPERGLVLMT